ncbi:MAG: hypothetical protein MJZ52_06830 [Bacteroidales bacterium]|nr:hypothetical protein [Bacteroidales bacterium]
MATKETNYYKGNIEVSKGEYERSFDSNSNTVTTETDWWGRQRVTKTDLWGTHTHTDSGYSGDESSAGLAALGGVFGAVALPLVLAGGVVYGTGKLIYKIVEHQKEKKVEREYVEWLKIHGAEREQKVFDSRVESILKKYNHKLEEYQELFDLGILTQGELDVHVQHFIKLSEEEISKEKENLVQRLLEMQERIKKGSK